MPSPNEFFLPANEWVGLPYKYFKNATDGALVTQETLVRLKQDERTLYIEFECKNDPYWKQTTPTEHNTSLWEQEVFEVFIAEGEKTPTRYLEVEINPNNALFVGWVENPDGEGTANVLSMVPYEKAGINHHITGTTQDSWRGELDIPLSLLSISNRVTETVTDADTTLRGATFRGATLRINFYRIILLESQSDPHWICNSENASFQCWSPTMSGTTPRFHRPVNFGVLHLD